MKKTLLALAVVSIATAATAEVKLSGRIGTELSAGSNDSTWTIYDEDGKQIGDAVTSETTDRSKFSDAGSELNIDASEQIGGLTAYAHAELAFGGLDNGDDAVENDYASNLAVDEVRLGIKGAFGDVQVGDVASSCDDLTVGGTYEIQLADQAAAGCNDGQSDSGIKYTGTFGPVKGGISYRPDIVAEQDEISVAVQGTVGPVVASLANTSTHGGTDSNDTSTTILGVKGNFAGAELGAQYAMIDGEYVDGNGYELNAKYALSNGEVYAGYGSGEVDSTTLAGDVTETNEASGFMVGYKQNLSSRTIAWVEYGNVESTETDFTYSDGNTATKSIDIDEDAAWSVGLRHSF